MQALRLEATIEKEGELHLTNLPLHPSQHVEVIVLIGDEPHQASGAPLPLVTEEAWRQLLATLRGSDPRFAPLEEAMRVSRGRP